MCFGAFFSSPRRKGKNSQSSSSEKRRNEQRDPLHHGTPSAGAQAPERNRSDRPDIKRSRETNRRADRRPRHQNPPYPQYTPKSGERHGPTLAVTVPSMYYRPIGSTSSNSSEEMLLNPRPDRTAHDKRQRHAKITSQSTLRGRGAKRQRTSDSRRDDHISSTTFPTTSSSKRRAQYQVLESSPRRQHRSTNHRHHHTPPSSNESESYRSPRRHPSHHHPNQHSSTRANTGARRDPDRRFAVLAATNTALEHLRREAFSQPSPPPRRERLRRYQGVEIPASRIPFDWDCVSSPQTSARGGESSSRQRRRR